jgi:thiol-disulfide isomerase/thioredoxin
MRHWIGIAALAALLLLASVESRAAAVANGDIAPAFEGTDASGQTVRFDPTQRKRPAVILFWATWCPYCKALMPHLQSVRNDVGSDALDVYAVDILEDDDADPAGFLAERGYDFTLVRAADSVPESYGVRGTPALFLVGVTGRVVYVRPNGAQPEAIETIIRDYVNGRAGAP